MFMPLLLRSSTLISQNTTTSVNQIESLKSEAFLARLAEIKAMDKTSMSSLEKKELRKEVRAKRGYFRHVGGGVYLSAGAIIIIILIIILLL